MRAVLRSLLAVVALLGLMGGAAFAVFTDSTTDTASLSTGSVNITKSSGGTWSGDIKKLVPGQPLSKTIVIRNAGTLDFEWAAHHETTGALFQGTTPPALIYRPTQGVLHRDETQAVDLTVELPSEAGNVYQSESGKLTLHFNASSAASP